MESLDHNLRVYLRGWLPVIGPYAVTSTAARDATRAWILESVRRATVPQLASAAFCAALFAQRLLQDALDWPWVATPPFSGTHYLERDDMLGAAQATIEMARGLPQLRDYCADALAAIAPLAYAEYDAGIEYDAIAGMSAPQTDAAYQRLYAVGRAPGLDAMVRLLLVPRHHGFAAACDQLDVRDELSRFTPTPPRGKMSRATIEREFRGVLAVRWPGRRFPTGTPAWGTDAFQRVIASHNRGVVLRDRSWSEHYLRSMRKDALVRFAEEAGVDASGSVNRIVPRLMALV